MASSKVCLVAVLCCFIFFTVFISSTESAWCCLSYSKHQPNPKKILGYHVQTITGSCDISAIVFHLRGSFVCADPSVRWTQKTVKFLKERKWSAKRILSKRHSNVAN